MAGIVWLAAAICSGLPPGASAEPPKLAEPPPQRAEPKGPARATSGWTALPIASYTPETELGLGGFAAHFFRLGADDPDTRPSSVAAVALVTTRRQVVLELIPELYWNGDRNRLWSKLDYRYYPNSFWGIGPHTRDDQREWYRENGPRLQMHLRRLVAGPIYLEGRIEAQFSKVERFEPDGQLITGRVPGSDASRLVGVGPAVGWDSRDHILSPHDGGLYELSTLQFHSMSIGDYNFNRTELNLRRYIPFGQHTLALQLYSELALGSVPFYRMPMLGGQRLLRGYFEGRYRDRLLVLTQAEYRFPLFWRLGAVAFLGFGEVAPTLTRFDFWPLKWSAGGGLRFLLSSAEQLNLRADLGVGYRTWGLYIGVAEAF